MKKNNLSILLCVTLLNICTMVAQNSGIMNFGNTTVVLTHTANPSVNESENILLNNFNISGVSSETDTPVYIAFATDNNGAGTDVNAAETDAVLGWFGNGNVSVLSATLATNGGNEIGIRAFNFAYERAVGNDTLNFTITGKKDGIEVGTLKLDTIANNTLLNIDLANTTTGTFSDIDEMVITPENPIFGGFTIDDLEITTAVSVSSTYTWSGTTDNNWQTASNWSGNAVPPVSADVIVPNNITNYPTISSAVTVNSINIASGASLIANATVTAPVTYTRNLPTTNWYLVSAPVTGETQQDVIANHTFATGTSGNIGIGAFQNNTGSAWVFANNATTGPIISGAGVSMKLAAPGDLTITGNLNVTNVSFPVATGTRNNFNLIGNPFTSYVNSATLANNNTVIENATFWLWDGSQYTAHNNASSIDIAPAQGFFVEANSNTNIVFSTANQSHQTTDTFQKKTPTPSFELFVESGNNKRATKVFYIEGKTTGFDSGYDSKIFGGVAQSFGVFTHLVADNDGSKLAIQTLPNSNLNEMVIPVGVIAQAGTEVTFSLETSNFSEAVNVYLEDRINNTFTDITAGNTTVTVAEVANNVGQFYIHTQSKSLSTNTQTTAAISIYASSKSEITVTGLQGKANVTLLSLLGKQMVSKQINSNGNSTILLPNLPTGVYIANLQTSAGTVTKKIIID